jgi:agmatine deiminase
MVAQEPARRQWLRQAGGWFAAAAAGGCAGATTAPERDASADGWRLVGEFEPPSAIWLSHDAGHEALTAGLVAALKDHVPLRLLVRDAGAEERAQAFLKAQALPALPATVEPLASFFTRDLAVFARGPGARLGVVDFGWAEYGVPEWCRRRHADPAVARHCAGDADFARAGTDRALAAQLGARVLANPLAIEGGGVEANGQGLLIANEALWRSRNPGLDRAALDAALRRLPGIRKVIWLPEGLAEDPLLRATITGDYVAWGTGGHTDEFVRFAAPRTVLLAWPDDADAAAHPVARLTRRRMERNLALLERAGDADGHALEVVKVPMPRPIERRVFLSAFPDGGRSRHWSAEHFPPAEGRWQGQALTEMAIASYLNFVLADGVVVLPDALPHGTPRARQERVRRLFEQVFPGRRVVFVDAISAHWVGGGPHCATLSQP